MHSTLTRVQGVFGFFTSVAFALAGVIALSALIFPGNPTTSVSLKNVQVIKGRPHYYSSKKEEYAQIRFDLDADFSSLFNWNTKQLFVYVLATYPSSPSASPGTPASESVIWDAIIPAPESPYSLTSLKERFLAATSPAKASPKSKSKKTQAGKKANNKKTAKKDEETPGLLRLRNQRPKYQITDVTGKIAEKENVTLTVGWNVQPWVGALLWSPGTGASGSIGVSTGGEAGRSKPFDFPALKGSKPSAAAGTGAETASA